LFRSMGSGCRPNLAAGDNYCARLVLGSLLEKPPVTLAHLER
jgi:hypothetical protein